MKNLLLTLLVIALFALHQDFWNWRLAGPFLLGFLPVGLAYHLGYSFAAAGVMALLVRYAWPKDLESAELETAPAPKREAKP
jgi:hypothetical protein